MYNFRRNQNLNQKINHLEQMIRKKQDNLHINLVSITDTILWDREQYGCVQVRRQDGSTYWMIGKEYTLYDAFGYE
jgi:hypothetical protein